MKIDDFLLEKQPIDKLVSSYVELEQVYDKAARADNRSKETLLLNSLLVALATNQTTLAALWSEIKYCLEVNSGDRECLRRGAQLLTEVFKRNPHSLQAAPKEIVLEIIGHSCEKALITICGNDFIALIQHITSRLSMAVDLQEALPTITTLIASNKLQVNTYRQQTRLCLYKILLRVLDLHQQKATLLEKCVRAGEGEKDPRNIAMVFELYLKILSLFSEQQLLPFRAAMFESIEAYYPIEFVGDEDNEEHRKVNFGEISSLLDQCLCHPFFSELTWELLSSKTAAPPLAPFISTLLAYFRSLRRFPNPALKSRLASLLLRFSQEEFIAEEYEEHASQDLSTVIEGLLDVIFCREDGCFSLEAYSAVKKWLDLMLEKVTNGECHHSGTMMGLFRAIINRSSTPRFAALVALVRQFSLKVILKTISDGEIIPKLGLAVVVVTSAENVSEDVRELIGLLALKIGSLYGTVTDEVKLLLLKILLEIYKGAECNRAMVRKVNDGLILKDILSRAQAAFSSSPNPNQAYMVKAFIDFVATVHLNELELLLQHITGINFELEGYLLGRLWENTCSNKQELRTGKKIIDKFNELIQLMGKPEDGEDLIKGLRVTAKPSLLQLVLAANWQRQGRWRELTFSVLLTLRKELETLDYEANILQQLVPSTELSHIVTRFFLHRNQDGLALSKEEQLWRALGHQELTSITFPLTTQLATYDIHSQFYQKFISAYPPTFVQWSWEQLKASQDCEAKGKRLGQILRWLPEPILLRDRKEVLGLILTDGRCAPSLLKIVKHIEVDTIKSSGILEYCLQYISSLASEDRPENTTERSTCILATLISIAQRDKGGELKQLMQKGERAFRQLRQHRKRPVRQAVRRLLSVLQE